MKIGLCNRMAEGWLKEFVDACTYLHVEYEVIQIGRDNWMDQLRGVDIFIWRLVMGDPSCMAEARSKIPLIEEMGISCFPNRQMLWLYDDKIRETFFFRQHRYPVPKTWVFFELAGACDFAAKASYPLIAKSHCGASSSGVIVLRSPSEAERLLKRIFRRLTLWEKIVMKYYYIPHLKKGDLLLLLRYTFLDSWPRYAYFQEFIHTVNDWRVTTLGEDLVSVFVRKNRPDDFRASGSGLWEKVSEAELPIAACDIALRISKEQGFTSMAFDFMFHENTWVIGEISYAFVLNDVYTETLFRKGTAGYQKIAPIPIGVMHLNALIQSQTVPRDALGEQLRNRHDDIFER